MGSISDGGEVGGCPSCTVEVLWFANAMRGRNSVGRHDVAGMKKGAKETCQPLTPLRPGLLLDAFVGMPCLGGIAKAVDGHQPFVIFRPGMARAELIHGSHPPIDVILETPEHR